MSFYVSLELQNFEMIESSLVEYFGFPLFSQFLEQYFQYPVVYSP